MRERKETSDNIYAMISFKLSSLFSSVVKKDEEWDERQQRVNKKKELCYIRMEMIMFIMLWGWKYHRFRHLYSVVMRETFDADKRKLHKVFAELSERKNSARKYEYAYLHQINLDLLCALSLFTATKRMNGNRRKLSMMTSGKTYLIILILLLHCKYLITM